MIGSDGISVSEPAQSHPRIYGTKATFELL